MNARRMFLLVAALVFAAAVPMFAGRGAPEDPALNLFSKRVAAYASLRAGLPVGAPRLTSSAEELLRDVEALGAAIRARRVDAKVGDIFTPDVSAAFRRVIGRSFRLANEPPADVLARNRAELLPGAPALAINARFPWQLGAAMPTCLLVDLPPLPGMLQYRLVDRDLLLVDIDAGLVIDILRDAVEIDPAASQR
jgi:hypothetical protein